LSLILSWVETANVPNHPFPLNNLPYGVFSTKKDGPRCGVRIGDVVLDLKAMESEGYINFEGVFESSYWNDFIALGEEKWTELRQTLFEYLHKDFTNKEKILKLMHKEFDITMHLPIKVAEYTDFYSGRNHAQNVGTMFRGPENALPPNWLHMPIGYNGRASSVVVSGTDIRRPYGQLKGPDFDMPKFLPSRRFDFELEMGAIVGKGSNGPVSVDQADDMIFGYVILNDWSARDIQAWEYVPLGPFQAKATATSISPWIVTKDALEPFRCSTPKREYDLLPYLKDTKPMLYDIELSTYIQTEASNEILLSTTNFREMYYSSAQQIAHHTSSGCPMNVCDLIGSGTISGEEKNQRGSMLELSWGGKEPIKLENNETRTFLEDGDLLTLRGQCNGSNYSIGFGKCSGRILPAKK
tara:strand:+ start:4371 stop:5606 length:1236 start_codon:yes stop_codon:yes gene_type:complete